MHNRHDIAGFLGYYPRPMYPDEVNEKIDRLLAIEAEQGPDAMLDVVAEILRESSATEFVLENIEFLAELTELSRKHSRFIGSSGYGDLPHLCKTKAGSKGRYTATPDGEDIEWEEADDA